MDNERLPIKFFAPREIDELRVEGNRNQEPPRWLLTGQDLIDRSTQLLDAFHSFSDIFEQRTSSPIPFVFVAKMCEDATAKSRRKDIMNLFQTAEKSNVLGLISSDELIVKVESPAQMDEFGFRIGDYERNSYAISCLETFRQFEPIVQWDEENEAYKIKLIDFQNYETNIAMQRLFEQRLTEKSIAYQKTLYTSQVPKSLIQNGFYTGQIIATLVYEPILDPSQGIEYCQSNIDLKFGTYDSKTERDTQRRGILNPVGRQGSQNLFRESLYSKRLMRDNSSDFALRERLLIQYGDKYYPVKKYAVDLSELSDANKQHYITEGKKWYLTLRGLFREHTEQQASLERSIPKQDLCLIITVRDPNRIAPIYNDVTQGLDNYHFWHSNIKLSNDVTVNV